MIVCCGEALIDMVATCDTSGRTAYVACPGGAALNCAVALGRLGCDAALFSGLSTDFFGDQIRNHMQQSGVSRDLCQTGERPTPIAFATIEQGQAQYSFFNENSALSELDAAPELPDSCSALVFGGISLAQGRSAPLFERMMLAPETQRLKIIDANIRPAVIQDETAYRARLAGMFAEADLIKVSDEDLLWLDPDPPPVEQARALLSDKTTIVLLTHGARGATAVTTQGEIAVAAPAVDLEHGDTIGAGDTFTAGFLAHLARAGMPATFADLDAETPRDALRFAVRVAGMSVTRKGADPPWAHEVF